MERLEQNKVLKQADVQEIKIPSHECFFDQA